jgi:uncharacterized protein (DUF736 family)
MSNLQKSPDYINYSSAWNCAYHDYNMSSAVIAERLGKEPKKYVELNARHQVANLAHQNREAVAACGNNALIVYDAFMRGEDMFAAWAATQPEGSDAEYIMSKIKDTDFNRAWVADLAELDDLQATYDDASGRGGYG